MEWLEGTRKAADGKTDVTYWISGDFEIEKHPFSDKYMLTRNGDFLGICGSLSVAQREAKSRKNRR